MAVTIIVKDLLGGTTAITFSDDEKPFEAVTVTDVEERLYHILGIPVGQCTLIFNGVTLISEQLLSEYGIQHMSIVHAHVNLRGGGGDETHGMGERADRNASKEQLFDFDATDTGESWSCCIF